MDNKFSKYIFIILTVICSVLIVLSTIETRAFDPIRSAVGYVLVPVQTGVNRAGVAIYNKLEEIRELKDVRAENEELRARIDSLSEENNRLKSETEELYRLRELYSLDTEYMQYPKVAARVIAKDSNKWFQVFRIDKGSADGIEVDMNVLAGGGLVGIVTEVGANYATVRSIIDDESSVSAMSQHSADGCFINGDLELYEQGLLRITDIERDANLSDGDAIITSNISSKYLPGILIGYASDITMDSQQLTKSGYLIPAGQFSNLQEVLVITMTKSEYGITDQSGDVTTELLY